MHALLRVPIPELTGMGRAVSLKRWGAWGRRGSPQGKHQEFLGTAKHQLMEGSTAEPSTKPFTHGKEAENGTSQAHLEPKPAALGTTRTRLVWALTGTPVSGTKLQGLDGLCVYM